MKYPVVFRIFAIYNLLLAVPMLILGPVGIAGELEGMSHFARLLLFLLATTASVWFLVTAAVWFFRSRASRSFLFVHALVHCVFFVTSGTLLVAYSSRSNVVGPTAAVAILAVAFALPAIFALMAAWYGPVLNTPRRPVLSAGLRSC